MHNSGPYENSDGHSARKADGLPNIDQRKWEKIDTAIGILVLNITFNWGNVSLIGVITKTGYGPRKISVYNIVFIIKSLK